MLSIFQGLHNKLNNQVKTKIFLNFNNGPKDEME